MKNFHLPLLGLLALATVTSSCVAQNSAPIALSQGTLFQADFETGAGWLAVRPTAIGTIDVAGSTQPSQGLIAKSILSGPCALENSETNLGKLTLAFSLSASAATPVTVRVESFDKNQKRTGGLETQIFPPAPDFYQRFALDLDKMQPSGAGKFVPDAPFVGFSFQADGAEIRLDNVQFAKPAFYVSETGSDKNDGRTEATAFATPQKAVDMAGAGDIIDVMNGTYKPIGVQDGIVRFKKPGAPAAWISLKNYPGHSPLFDSKGTWVAVRFWYSDAQLAADQAAGVAAPIPAYIEVRGLHIRGNSDTAKTEFPDLVGKAAPETNSNGISVGWPGKAQTAPHHLRFADNLVEFCPGAGIGPGQSDWVTIENNVIRNNSWTTIYATSGISINGGSNFDGTSGGYRTLIRNNETSGNRTFEIWKQIGKVSDGNGIIIDVNQDSKAPEELRYNGRTLIANNLTYNNGGSGIHAFKSKRVDVINNTVYMNSASPELDWGQMFVQQSSDVRFINNIVVAPPDQPVNTNGAKYGDQNSKDIYRAGNLYFGGGTAPIMGEGDVIGDPQFENPSIDAAVADFRLKADSPAIGTGVVEPILPATGLKGKMRGTKPDKGAYQH